MRSRLAGLVTAVEQECHCRWRSSPAHPPLARLRHAGQQGCFLRISRQQPIQVVAGHPGGLWRCLAPVAQPWAEPSLQVYGMQHGRASRVWG